MLRLIAAFLADRFDLPAVRAIDARLIAGAALFGIGGGLVGFCLGPAFASLSPHGGGDRSTATWICRRGSPPPAQA
jgi:uncharacterized membrane protein YedE/YeeE